MDRDIKRQVRNCASRQEKITILKRLRLKELAEGEYIFFGKELKKHGIKNPYKVAYLSNCTIEPLHDIVHVYGAYNGFDLQDYINPYNQYMQELINPQSLLSAFDPHVIFLNLSLKSLSPSVFYVFNSLTLDDKLKAKEDILNVVKNCIYNAMSHTNAVVLVCNFPRPVYTADGISDLKSEYGETEFYNELNTGMMRLLKGENRAFVFDIEKIMARFGNVRAVDPKMYYLAKVEWSQSFMPQIASEFLRFIKAINNVTKKCLVVDLDNTLWGGILGEEGINGIKVSQDDPIGEAFYDFQRKILTIKNRGILLALCSKNNRDDVMKLFQQRTDMPLSIDDFAVIEANWKNKHENLILVAEKLNIGIDSLVFVDDNPSECELVRQMLPQVTIIQLPKDPAGYCRILDEVDFFEKAVIIQGDRGKAVQYKQKTQRDSERACFGDLNEYLKSLEIQVCIYSALAEDLVRVHQLFNKTNQFNVTTIRYSLGDIEKIIADDTYNLTLIEARDRFGALGIIGLYFLKRIEDSTADIDSLIISCRALGKGIESVSMNHLKNKCFSNAGFGVSKIIARFIPTAKNKPAELFFDEQGFSLISAKDNEKKEYVLNKDTAKEKDCDWITILTKEEYDGKAD